ncbi:MAG: hypothetical protein V3U75_08700 [Methylococcaceae bacterium]
MKTLSLLIIAAAIIFVLRINLPPNDIGNANRKESNDHFLKEIADQFMYSQAVADWQYTDFVVFKIACSDRLNVAAIAFPFEQWRVMEKKVESCNSS